MSHNVQSPVFVGRFLSVAVCGVCCGGGGGCLNLYLIIQGGEGEANNRQIWSCLELNDSFVFYIVKNYTTLL